MNLKGSKTEKCLYKTFAGECRARTKYSLYSERAKYEGLGWISQIFDVTADNEKAHARIVYNRFLKKMGCTEENLMEAAKGEAEESKKTYKEFENIAREEGFIEIADFYKELQEVEENHSKRFSKLAEKMKKDELLDSKETKLWQCMNCGYIYEGNSAPKNCPLCNYPKGYFKEYCAIK
ncbi:Rubrerythrin [Clostridium sp. DSM 8431]|uniref:rubrerythrin family protein n=1 Tax=Clostridium sp. DSM 8431 TaxID=1761781 RepID=UPI0008F1C5C0|nr:rubrerythrin family protein [Clostridium sp. DSM 8431]SFU47040.1 Rubrerythrin [Clostridium sp. DSM 8431]